MTTPRQEALQLLLEHAAAERDRLAVELRRADDACARAQAQVAQLAAYRNEYVERWASQFGRGGTIAIVQCYQSFMQRLDEACAQAAAQADAAQLAATRVRDALVAAEIRAASVRKLVERRLQERTRTEQRVEQRASDETGQQLAVRRLRGGLTAMQH